ncbi:maestro heat-like repeat-containing protein family member 1 [Amia ocellicauda]|uniref:maestro heat-like repeat-containing protein family member 1 n=1 Tax=Amia ocellicauda TaxID=2972642 RepID=UPI003463F491
MTMVTDLLQFIRIKVLWEVPVGRLLAFLVPHCHDPAVMKEAVKGIKAVLDLWLCGKGDDLDRYKEVANMMQCINEQSSVSDTCAALTQVVSSCLLQPEKETLIEGLIQGLRDSQPSTAHGSCALLCDLLQANPTELTAMFAPVLHAFLGLSDVKESVRHSMRQAVVQLVLTDRVTVINSLISYRSPAISNNYHWQWQRELWGAIEEYCPLPWTLRVLVNYLQTTGRDHNVLAVYAVRDILSKVSLVAVNMEFQELFSTLLPLLGPENPAPAAGFSVKSAAVEALQALLFRAQLINVSNQLDQDGAWVLFSDHGQEPELIFLLTRALLMFAAPVLPDVVHQLSQRYSTMGASQKFCVAAFFSALLMQSHLSDRRLLVLVTERTLELCEDPLEDTVRLAVQGLNTLPKKEILRFALEQLKVLTGALPMWAVEGKPVILKAISTLVTILQLCTDEAANKLIPKAYHTAKECLENPDAEICRATVFLLGALVKRAAGSKELKKQCHGSLARLLLHLQDSRLAVSQACQLVLQQCTPHFTGFNVVIEDHFSREKFIFSAFIRDMTALLHEHFPGVMAVYRDVALRFSNSSSPALRSSAAVFIGALLEKIEKSICNIIASWKLKRALSHLLKDSDSRVQKTAAEAMPGVHQP